MYVARKASHIQEDLARNWSSWSFGGDGVKAETAAEVAEMIENCRNGSFFISGFEIWIDEEETRIDYDFDEVRFNDRSIKYTLRQLYPSYWVVVDDVNAKDGLSCVFLEAETLGEAVEEAKKAFFDGDGDCFDAKYAKLVATLPDETDGIPIHILEY